MPGSVFITVHPDMMSADALKLVTAVIAIGPKADEVIAALCKGAGIKPPDKMAPPKDERVLFWRPGADKKPRLMKAIEPKQSLKRHSRKYAEGTLDEKGSFYFRGPDNAMNLRAQNLMIFQQIAEGIDDKTWEYHLRKAIIPTGFVTRSGTRSWPLKPRKPKRTNRFRPRKVAELCSRRCAGATPRPPAHQKRNRIQLVAV